MVHLEYLFDDSYYYKYSYLALYMLCSAALKGGKPTIKPRFVLLLIP